MKKQVKGNSLGISFILIIFIILCLITFGTLSYMQVSRDNDLSISAAENIQEFYSADMMAQAQLQVIDAILQEEYTVAKNKEEYMFLISEEVQALDNVTLDEEVGILKFQTEVSEKEVLISTLEIVYPVEDAYYVIKSWVLESNTDS